MSGWTWRMGWGAAMVAALAAGACDKDRSSDDSSDPNAGLTGGRMVFEETFDGQVNENWTSLRPESYRVIDNALEAQNAQNEPMWLIRPLPDEVRVELDATAMDGEGDIKVEIFGDGEHHQSGYILIYGGWDNRVTCIARLDEHGDDRLDAERHNPIVPHQTYHVAVVRTDNRVRFFIDGTLVLSYDDNEPLRGQAHRFFAINDWAAPVRFDNVRVYDLGE